MNSIIKIISVLLLPGISGLHAQTLNYQGVARNASGSPLANTSIAIRLSIKDALTDANVLYRETKSVNTNSFGLYTVVINDGTGSFEGDFHAIDWANRERFLQTEIDPANGSAFSDMGTTQMHSVPHALVADNLKGIVTPKEGHILEYRDGKWIQKPKPKGGYIFGVGQNPVTSNTPRFVGPTYKVVVEEDNPIITMSISKAMGSTLSTGGLGLNIGLGYQKVGETTIHYFKENGPIGVNNIRVAGGTRVPIALSGRFRTDFKAGEEYIVGMTAHSISSGHTWNDNGSSMGYVEVSY